MMSLRAQLQNLKVEYQKLQRCNELLHKENERLLLLNKLREAELIGRDNFYKTRLEYLCTENARLVRLSILLNMGVSQRHELNTNGQVKRLDEACAWNLSQGVMQQIKISSESMDNTTDNT